MKNKKFIPVNTPSLNGNEKKYLIDCIESGYVSSVGKYVTKFEKNIKTMIKKLNERENSIKHENDSEENSLSANNQTKEN